MRKVLILLATQLIVTLAVLQDYSFTYSSNRPRETFASLLFSAGVLTTQGTINVNLNFLNPEANTQRTLKLSLMYDVGNAISYHEEKYNIPIPSTPGSIDIAFLNVPPRSSEYIVSLIGTFYSTLNVIEVTTTVDGTDVTKKVGTFTFTSNAYLIYMNQQQSISVSSSAGTMSVRRGSDLNSFGSYLDIGSGTQTVTLEQGYHVLTFNQGANVTYQSDSYPCPFSS